jgi:biotin carboxyl carrier protein
MKMPEYEVLIEGKKRKIELSRSGEKSFTIMIDGKTRRVEIDPSNLSPDKPFTIKIDGKAYQIEMPIAEQAKEIPVKVYEAVFKAEIRAPARKIGFATFQPTTAAPTKKTAANKQILEGAVAAPMTGKIVSLKVKKGDQVKAGQVLCVIEAMKMENEILAPKPGTVNDVIVSEGSSVSEGDLLLTIG